MNISKTFEPVGFTKVAGPVTKLQWSPDRFVSVEYFARNIPCLSKENCQLFHYPWFDGSVI